jgi:predicted MarR family transcription regulator
MTQSPEATALTRLELAIFRVYEAFGRWAVELHRLCDEGARPIGFHDIALLHCIRMRGHEPSVSELLHFLNRHDIANVQYSIKKLTKCGLVKALRKIFKK